jgi:hypothetical protein
MKRRERQRRVRAVDEDQRLAQAALEELRAIWKTDRRARRRRTSEEAARLMRLAAETREMLALWTYYRLASLDAMDGRPMGVA